MKLSQMLREGTKEVHLQLELSRFIGLLFKGELEKGKYIQYLSYLFELYSCLEEGLFQNKNHPYLSKVYSESLFRKGNIESDLIFFQKQTQKSDLESLISYRERIKKLSDSSPLLLVSHAYVRYMGDLSGGQLLRKKVSETYGLIQQGLSFFQFPEDSKILKERFRDGLDSIELSGEQKDEVLREAIYTFQLNFQFFKELELKLLPKE
ncbi:MAG: biliverdin-producing heme oxygenase [Leptospiraceae bacterium]|nr:biliverdin-producing heme oxygenase [Leptospiraceae bacterium]